MPDPVKTREPKPPKPAAPEERLTQEDLLRMFATLQEGQPYSAPGGTRVVFVPPPPPPPPPAFEGITAGIGASATAGAAPASPSRPPLTPEELRELMRRSGGWGR